MSIKWPPSAAFSSLHRIVCVPVCLRPDLSHWSMRVGIFICLVYCYLPRDPEPSGHSVTSCAWMREQMSEVRGENEQLEAGAGGLEASLCTSPRAPSLLRVVLMPTPWGHVLFRSGLHICGLTCFSSMSWEGSIIIPVFSREGNGGSGRERLSQGHTQ